MITGVKDPNRFLYHYTKARTVIDYILKDFTLRLGPYTQTNDPKETKAWEFDLGTNQTRDLGKQNINELSEQMNQILKSKTGVLCFCQDDDGLTGSHLEDVTRRGFMKPRMWAQYGDNHRGLCLVIDKTRFLNAFKVATERELFSVHGLVAYANRSFLHGSAGYVYTINVDFLEDHGIEKFCWAYIKQHYKNLFFEKMTDWSSEKEYRCLIFRSVSEAFLVSIRDSLRGIMFGESVDPDHVLEVQELTATIGVETMGIIWKNACPWYDYGNPLYSPALRK